MATQSISYESIINETSIKEYTCISSSPSSSIAELFTAEEEFTAFEEDSTFTTATATATATTSSTSYSTALTSTSLPSITTAISQIELSNVSLNEEKECRICFCTESETADEKSIWITPCKCDGSMKWVHRSCFEQWIKMAPINQQNVCTFCGFTYQKGLKIQSIHQWTIPPFRVIWQFLGLDLLSTLNLLIGCRQIFQGKKYFVWQILNFIYWKKYTLPRIKNGRIITDIMQTSIFKAEIIDLNEK